MRVDLAERIRTRREDLGMSQEDLAVSAGMSRTSVSNIECGNLPQVKTLLRIERALGLEPGELLRDTRLRASEEMSRALDIPE